MSKEISGLNFHVLKFLNLLIHYVNFQLIKSNNNITDPDLDPLIILFAKFLCGQMTQQNNRDNFESVYFCQRSVIKRRVNSALHLAIQSSDRGHFPSQFLQ